MTLTVFPTLGKDKDWEPELPDRKGAMLIGFVTKALFPPVPKPKENCSPLAPVSPIRKPGIPKVFSSS